MATGSTKQQVVVRAVALECGAKTMMSIGAIRASPPPSAASRRLPKTLSSFLSSSCVVPELVFVISSKSFFSNFAAGRVDSSGTSRLLCGVLIQLRAVDCQLSKTLGDGVHGRVVGLEEQLAFCPKEPVVSEGVCCGIVSPDLSTRRALQGREAKTGTQTYNIHAGLDISRLPPRHRPSPRPGACGTIQAIWTEPTRCCTDAETQFSTLHHRPRRPVAGAVTTQT